MSRSSIRTSIRSSVLLAIALGFVAIGSAATPAAAFPSQNFGSRNEQIYAHFLSVHEHTTVGMSRYRFPGKKKK